MPFVGFSPSDVLPFLLLGLDLDKLNSYVVRDLRSYCQKKEITVKGRLKQDFIAAILAYEKKNNKQRRKARQAKKQEESESEDEDRKTKKTNRKSNAEKVNTRKEESDNEEKEVDDEQNDSNSDKGKEEEAKTETADADLDCLELDALEQYSIDLLKRYCEGEEITITENASKLDLIKMILTYNDETELLQQLLEKEQKNNIKKPTNKRKTKGGESGTDEDRKEGKDLPKNKNTNKRTSAKLAQRGESDEDDKVLTQEEEDEETQRALELSKKQAEEEEAARQKETELFEQALALSLAEKRKPHSCPTVKQTNTTKNNGAERKEEERREEERKEKDESDDEKNETSLLDISGEELSDLVVNPNCCYN